MFDLKIGFNCNNNCKHCVVANKRPAGDMPLENIFQIVDHIPQKEGIQLTGGEPSIYGTKLLKILERCKKNDLFVCIQTNATGFSDKSFFNQCKPYIDHFHVAIHSSDPIIHDYIVGSSGMWEKTIKGFHNIIIENKSCTTQTVLSKYNIKGLLDTYDFIQQEKPKTIMSMTYPHLMGNAYTNHKNVAFRYSDYKNEIQNCLKKYGKYIQTEAIPYCYLYPYISNIHSIVEKEIYENKEGFSAGIDFSDGYNIKNYIINDLTTHKKAPLCKQCIYNNICIGVWQEYIQFFKNNLDLYPIKEEK